METPAYSENTQSLPAYVDSPFLPPPTDTKPAPQSVWIQDSDVSGFTYRRRYVLSADAVAVPPPQPVFDAVSPPTYTAGPAPIYTVKSHGQPSPIEALLGSQPDFTIYIGEGDSGPVVATGILHTSPLKKSLGELRFFPRVSTSQPGESSSSASKEIPSVTLKEKNDGKKYTFISFGYDFEWNETGPGERPPTPPPEEEEEDKSKSTGFFSKMKRKSVKPAHPKYLPLRDTKTWELTAYDAKTATTTKIATYRELQPADNAVYTYSATAPKYKDGHTAKLDVHEPTFEVLDAGGKGARELAVASIMLLVEAQRKKIVNSRNRNWLDGLGYNAVGGGGGACGGI